MTWRPDYLVVIASEARQSMTPALPRFARNDVPFLTEN